MSTKNFKKLIGLFIVVCMVVSVIPTVSFAAKPATSFTAGAYDYYILDASAKTLQVLNFSASATTADKTNMVIPEKVTYGDVEYTVTSIWYAAFSNITSIVSVKLPDTITTIGGNQFYGDTNLETINLPESLVSATDGAAVNMSFYDCRKLKSVTVPASVEKMARVFQKCYALKSVIFKGKNTVLGNHSDGTGVFDNVKDQPIVFVPDGMNNDTIQYLISQGVKYKKYDNSMPLVVSDPIINKQYVYGTATKESNNKIRLEVANCSDTDCNSTLAAICAVYNSDGSLDKVVTKPVSGVAAWTATSVDFSDAIDADELDNDISGATKYAKSYVWDMSTLTPYSNVGRK